MKIMVHWLDASDGKIISCDWGPLGLIKAKARMYELLAMKICSWYSIEQ